MPFSKSSPRQSDYRQQHTPALISVSVLLRQFGQRLQQAVRKADTVARLDGDEFVIVLEGIQSASDVEHIADKIIEAMHQLSERGGTAFTTGESSGNYSFLRCPLCVKNTFLWLKALLKQLDAVTIALAIQP